MSFLMWSHIPSRGGMSAARRECLLLGVGRGMGTLSLVLTSSGVHYSGQYASYWNAFSFSK